MAAYGHIRLQIIKIHHLYCIIVSISTSLIMTKTL